jgi:hypothetical protein
MSGSETFSTSTRSNRINPAFVLLFLLPFLSGPCAAQFVQKDRLEIPVGRDEGPFEVIPADDNGIFLHRRFMTNDGDRLQLIKLDTSFAVSWQGFLPVNSRFELMGKRSFDKKTYLLFRHREIGKKDLELIILQNETGQFVKHVVRNYIPFIPSDFQITEKAAIVGGYFNNIPVVIHYSLITHATKVLPGLFNEAGELTQIKTEPSGDFEVLISARNPNSIKTIWIKSYDAEGNLRYQIPLETEGNKHLLFARSIKTENNLHFVAGTYGSSRVSEYSKGIFIARIDPNGLQQIRFYNYGDFRNFFKYLKARREQRLQERIAMRKIKGKKLKFNYRFIVHEIVPYQNQFVLLGEAFYAKYINVDRTYYGGFFTPGAYSFNGPIRNGRIFDGFRYTHAVVMGFDNNGNILWDNSFEINDVKTYNLEQFVKLQMQPDKIALLYVFDNKLRSKIIQGNNVLEGKTYYPLQNPGAGQLSRSERSASSRLNYWYDNYFYAFGVQELDSGPDFPQRIFFISKINYAQNTRD